MRKFRYISNLLILVVSISWSQQETAITQYWSNMNIINPAYAGYDGQTSATIMVRDQWSGIDQSPQTQMLTFDTYLGRNVGLGLSMMRDKTFIETQTVVSIDFSYRLKVSEKTQLFLGIKAGGNDYNVNTVGLNTYNIFSDPSLESINNFTPNVGLGGLLVRGDWYVSLSVPRLLNTERARNDNGQATVATDRPHYYLSSGYKLGLDTDRVWTINPSFLLRYVNGAPISIDINTMLRLENKFGFGVTYRTDQALAWICSISISPNFTLGYAYETSTRSTLAQSGNTNEFMLSLRF
ncbi:type IX secretion system membrane protein PorP/SprF [Nonlabens sp.]|uniref:PorP/SprF family type IX secretion system membrane protein n=1 Tax=Nonlabens sp. TaxID=1888209 RepID=UPI001BD04BAB|nr:type IX secretion system membrane protein PorP/SprF [Nonlabens sp.]